MRTLLFQWLLGEARVISLCYILASDYGRGMLLQAFPLCCKDFIHMERVLYLIFYKRQANYFTNENGLICRHRTYFKYELVKIKPRKSCFECGDLQSEGPYYFPFSKRRTARAALIPEQPEWLELAVFAEAISRERRATSDRRGGVVSGLIASEP